VYFNKYHIHNHKKSKLELDSKKIGLLTIFGVVLFYVIFIIFSDFDKISKTLLSINLIYIPLILLIHVFAIIVRGLRQKILLDRIQVNIKTKDNILIQFAGLSMILTPGGSGEIVKSYFLKKKFGFEFKKTASLFIIEKFHDLLAIVVILGIMAIIISNLEVRVIVIIMMILLIAFTILIKNKIILLKILEKIPKKGFLKFFQDLPEQVDLLEKQIEKRTIFQAGSLGVLSWMLDAVAIFLGFIAFDLDYSFFESVSIVYASTIIGVISFIPGGIGVTETSMSALLVKSGLTLPVATSLVIFTRLTSIWFYTFIGFIVTKAFVFKNDD